jgi:putative transposase
VVTVQALCRQAGMTRQAYYQYQGRQSRRYERRAVVLAAVRQVRQLHPRMGVRKLLHKVRPVVQRVGICIGRDQLYRVMREADLLVKRRRRRVTTTESRHRFRTYKNIIRDKTPRRPHEIWVSDLTYIPTRQGFVYLALVTDAASRKIVGYTINDNLESEGCVRALQRALAQLPAGKQPIHHSDRGTQYCCHEYVQSLNTRGLAISMTEENHCYENALAERMNGILKREYLLDQKFATKSHAYHACEQAIWLYNHDRPHLALNMHTPAEIHRSDHVVSPNAAGNDGTVDSVENTPCFPPIPPSLGNLPQIPTFPQR